MLETGSELDLPQEPVWAERRSQLRVEDLERYRAVVLEVEREVDRGHASAAELSVDAVTVGECSRKVVADI